MCEYCGPNRQPGTGTPRPEPSTPRHVTREEIEAALTEAGIALSGDGLIHGIAVRSAAEGRFQVSAGQREPEERGDAIRDALDDAGIPYYRAGGRHGRMFGIN